MSEAAAALPAEGAPAPAVASGQEAAADQVEKQEGQAGAQGADGAEGEGEKKPEQKPPKTPEQREIERLRRGIDRRTRQLAEVRAQMGLTRPAQAATVPPDEADSEPLSLTRAQLREMVTAEAAKLAPTLTEQAAERQRREGVLQGLASTWGKERFDELAADLDDAFGGLMDRSGRPRPAMDAVFEADNPAQVIEYLADPDHVDEAEAIARMSAAQAGKAIAKLEVKLASAPKPTPKPSDKPQQQASKVPAPLEPVRAQAATSTAPNPADTKAWIRWRNEQERKGLV